MDEIIIVIASRGGAKIFQFKGPGNELHFIEAMDHPEGRLKNHDLLSGGPGETFDSHGHSRHDMTRQTEPVEEEARRFASSIADGLDRLRQQKKLKKIVIAAEGGFMGLLKGSMRGETTKLVEYVHKDLVKVPDRELHTYFQNIRFGS